MIYIVERIERVKGVEYRYLLKAFRLREKAVSYLDARIEEYSRYAHMCSFMLREVPEEE